MSKTGVDLADLKRMKWWGWGKESVSYSHQDKPALRSFVKAKIGVDLDKPSQKRIEFADLDVKPSACSQELRSALDAAVGSAHVVDDAMHRVVHGYGKSLRDLVRVRHNDLGRLPDVVVYPASEAETTAVVNAALAYDAVVIAFGGGTNIAGSLEAGRNEMRTVISVDVGRLDKVIDIDEVSRTARIQAGALGPDIEEQLNARGWTLGHFPDSFTHSTLGGWIATRSSGMQSDRYGDIADLTRAVRVVTPTGILATRAVPSTSTGPSVREMVLGSEGRLGIITEATVHVHRIPEERVILGYLFPNWRSSLQAMRDIAASDASPSVTRVSDSNETRFSFATSKRRGFKDRIKSKALMRYLKSVRRWDTHDSCLSFIGYEGGSAHVESGRKIVGEIVGRYGGLCIGTGPGTLYDQKKFDTPYVRDYLLERGALADVSETSAPWSQLQPLYDGVTERANKAFESIGVKGWIMCHLSHSYHSGACLYFTFAFVNTPEAGELEQYDTVKSAVQQAFMDFGGTLSHHHAVGVEHARWLGDDISPAGVTMLRALFDGVDPNHNFNPGKLL